MNEFNINFPYTEMAQTDNINYVTQEPEILYSQNHGYSWLNDITSQSSSTIILR